MTLKSRTRIRVFVAVFGLFHAVWLQLYFDFGPWWEAQFLRSNRLWEWWLLLFAYVFLNAVLWSAVLMFMGRKQRKEPDYWISVAGDIFVFYAIVGASLMVSDRVLIATLAGVGLGNLHLLSLPIAAIWILVVFLRMRFITRLLNTQHTEKS